MAPSTSRRARGRGDLAAALPVQVLMLARAHASTTSTRSCDEDLRRWQRRCVSPSRTRARWPSRREMLREAGYRQRGDGRELMLQDPDNGVEFFYLRPRDIAVYVGSGTLDVGITGRDLLLDSGRAGGGAAGLDFAAPTFRFAARPGPRRASDLAACAWRPPTPGWSASTWPSRRGRRGGPAGRGGGERRPAGRGRRGRRRGRDRGTLRQAGLEIVGEPILRSEAVLVGRAGPAGRRRRRAVQRRLRGADRPALRDDGLRHPGRPGGRGVRAHPGHRVADHGRRCTARAGWRCAPWCRAPRRSG
jgi:hypothetical protein